jgi:type IV pilus biogenesis protein CpaD/CtpE
MRKTILPALLSAAIAGCASTPPPGGNNLAAAVGTPVYLALKGPFCVVTVAIAAPLAGLSGFAPTAEAQELRSGLGDGIAENCGPPYVLTP